MSSRSTAWGTKEKRKVPYREASVACPLEWVSEEREEDSMDIHGSASTGTQGAKRRVFHGDPSSLCCAADFVATGETFHVTLVCSGLTSPHSVIFHYLYS